ncbi:MAG: hypothetical protein KBG28_13135 [Kofleriaceae bacterium]|jgi:hypothetical protein|nr:hypothetical protein [Kofleriaceae bacterium]MBP6840028.1 hypothetical protein [Kofleriaceae bacterium]MBP9204908.1 hypothetical protein [Kofleriaceae bacterium]
MDVETVYTSGYTPDPASARDVLAFMLTPASAFAPAGDEDELAAVTELLESAKAEALKRWYDAALARLRS